MAGPGVGVPWAHPQARTLVSLNLTEPVRELHLLGVLHLHSVSWRRGRGGEEVEGEGERNEGGG